MAVVQGHAVRRRAGIAPNTLVMAQEGNVSGEKPPVNCPVRGCGAQFNPGGETYFGTPLAVDHHVLLDHPRSKHAGDARDRRHNRRMDAVSNTLADY